MTFLVVLWLASAGPDDTPMVLVAQAQVESDMDMRATACPPHRGDYASADLASRRRPCYCGLWQTEAHSADECRAMRNPAVAALARQREMSLWLAFCAGDERCALSGYAGGVRASRRRDSTYVRRVLRCAKRPAAHCA